MKTRTPFVAGRYQGFSLVELMVAMVLGLFLIGAVIGVFLSNQESSRTQADLNNAQEAFRFASHTIRRVVQQGHEVDQPGNDEWLTVIIEPDGQAGYKDCLGFGIDPDDYPKGSGLTVSNTFVLVANDNDQRPGHDLDCTVEGVGSPITETIVGGLDPTNSTVLFGQAKDRYWADNSAWKAAGDVADWTDVRSVNVRLAMVDRRGEGQGRVGQFSATMRMPVFEAASEIGGGGATPGGNGGSNDEVDSGDDDTGNGDDGNGDYGNGDDGAGDEGSGDDGNEDGGNGDGDTSGGGTAEDDEPSFVSCICSRRGNSSNYRAETNNAACTDSCCDADPNKCNGNSCTFGTMCPVN